MDHEGRDPRFVTSSPCPGIRYGPEVVPPASMLAMLHFRVSIEDQISVACERAPLGMGDRVGPPARNEIS